jgi:sodium/potassium-transporting ATPase subunit alpha
LGLIQSAFSLVLFFTVLQLGGWKWGQELSSTDSLYRSATGLTFASVILMQIGNVMGRRSDRGSGLDVGLFRNHLMLVGIGIEVVFAWAILYYPPVQAVLGTGQVSILLFGFAWMGIPLVFGLDLARKRLLVRSATKLPAPTKARHVHGMRFTRSA